MATISLDNLVMYQYPKPKNPSKSPAIPHGTSSFPSHVTPSVARPSPSPPCASSVQPPVPIPLGKENLSFIPHIDLATTRFHSQSGDFHQHTGSASVDFDTGKEHDMCNFAIDQDESQNSKSELLKIRILGLMCFPAEKDYCNNHVDERNNSAKFTDDQEISGSGVLAPVNLPDLDTFSHISEEVGDGSTVPETPIQEISPDVANESVIPIEPSSLNCVDQASTSTAVAMPISEECLSSSTITALDDNESQPVVQQISSINGFTATDSIAPQRQRLGSDQIPRFGRKHTLQQRHCTAEGTTPKSLSVMVRRRNLRSSNTSRTRQRSHHSLLIESTASDDSNDSDYQESDHGVDQITKSVQKGHPAKRRKRVASGIESSFPRQETPPGRAHSAVSSTSFLSQSSPESMAQKSTGLEKIRIDGGLLRKVSLGRVEYCCWFTEDHGPTAYSPSVSDCLASFQKQANKQDRLTNMTDLQVINIEGFLTRELNPSGDIWCCSFKERYVVPQSEQSFHQEQPSLDENGSMKEKEVLHMPISAKGNEYSREEDELIVQLKEVQKLPWSRIAEHFPGRTKGTLQVRYCTTLKDKREKSHSKCRKRKVGQPKIVVEKPQQRVQSPTSGRRYSLRQSRHSPDLYIAK
jgi:hypothetical protein